MSLTLQWVCGGDTGSSIHVDYAEAAQAEQAKATELAGSTSDMHLWIEDDQGVTVTETWVRR